MEFYQVCGICCAKRGVQPVVFLFFSTQKGAKSDSYLPLFPIASPARVWSLGTQASRRRWLGAQGHVSPAIDTESCVHQPDALQPLHRRHGKGVCASDAEAALLAGSFRTAHMGSKRSVERHGQESFCAVRAQLFGRDGGSGCGLPLRAFWMQKLSFPVVAHQFFLRTLPLGRSRRRGAAV